MKKILTIAATLLMLASLGMSAQTSYGTRNKQYRPKPGTVLGPARGASYNSSRSAYKPGFGTAATRFSAIVEGGPAFLLSSQDYYRKTSGDISLSAGAYNDMGFFGGVMVKYTGAGSVKLDNYISKASNTIIGADLRYFFPNFVVNPFIGGQAGAAFRHLGDADGDVRFYGSVKVGIQVPLGFFCSGLLAIGVESIGGGDDGHAITTLPITVGIQF